MTKLKIFVASPGDVNEERDIVSLVVEELNRSIGNLLGIELESIKWETHTWPDVGDDAQDVINRQIGDYDVLVGMMWKRFGSATKRAASGTGEEFERAHDYFREYQRPKIMFYFRTTPFYTTSSKDISQFRKVVQFRKKLEKIGVYYREYNDALEFERRLREQLTRQIIELSNSIGGSEEKKIVSPRIFLSYAREDLEEVERVYNALKAEKFSPWLDVRDILPGGEWLSEIQSAIKESDFFVFFISNKSVSKRGYLQKELETGLDTLEERINSDIYLIPVRLEPINGPDLLRKYQWIDLFLPDGLEKLILVISSVWNRRNND